MNWYLAVLKKYAVFSGRASRKEYWIFVLINVIISIILSLLDGVLGLKFGQGGQGLLSLLYTLAVLIPSLAVSVRRLHDTARSGWWLLICLVPVVGWIVLLIFFIQNSRPGAENYGPDPKTSVA